MVRGPRYPRRRERVRRKRRIGVFLLRWRWHFCSDGTSRFANKAPEVEFAPMHGQAVLYATRPAVLDAAWLHRDIFEDEAHLLPLDDALADLHSSAHACVVAPDKPLEFDRRGGLLPSPLVCDLLTRGGLAVKRYDAGEAGSLVVVALINPCTWTEDQQLEPPLLLCVATRSTSVRRRPAAPRRDGTLCSPCRPGPPRAPPPPPQAAPCAASR